MSGATSIRSDRRLMAYSAAAMYGGAAFLGLFEQFIPGGPTASLAPGLVAVAISPLLVLFGPKLPPILFTALGPAGVVMIGLALATSPGPGDGAVLYMWPVLWTSFFFGRAGAATIVASVGICHALVLWTLPAADGYPDRWFDVMISVSIVAAVVETLARRSEALLARVAGEARTDALTGLLNRRGFDEHAAVELARARREDDWLAVVTIDIDYFKRINDEWGHDTGDRVLAHVGAVLRSCTREIDVLGRVGGEEFVVLLPGCRADDAAALTDRVRDALLVTRSDLPLVRISAGVSDGVAPDGLPTLLTAADSALYAAKHAGRNQTKLAALVS
jgi:diguanylate cyclase (GGDEF)-like protein